MVKISYCKNCQKAKRFHVRTGFICKECKEEYKTLEVPRTRLFWITLIFIVIGFSLIAYSLALLLTNPASIAVPLGYFIFGITFFLFTLAVQFLDNEKMELKAQEIGIEKFGGNLEKDQLLKEDEATIEKSEKFSIGKKVPKKMPKKLPKTSTVPKSKSTDNFFSQPNVAHKISRKPIPLGSNKRKSINKVTEVIIQKPTKKRARKIRKAL